MLINFPLFLISFAIYNMIAFLTPGVTWSSQLFSFPMRSEAIWVVTFGDGLIALSLVFLLFEFLKAARTAARTLMDHLISTIVLVGALAEFVLVKEAATSVFAILILIALIDVLAGWSIAAGKRRAVAVEQPAEPAPSAGSEHADGAVRRPAESL